MCFARVYQVASVKSEWNCIKTFPDLSGTGHLSPSSPPLSSSKSCMSLNVAPTDILVVVAGKVTCVKFGPDSKYIAVGSMDHNLRIFGLPSEDTAMES